MYTNQKKIQYKTIIKYEEIESVNIVIKQEDSLGHAVALILPISFLEFNCKKGGVKRIFITYFTKKQRAKILKEIKERMNEVSNLRT